MNKVFIALHKPSGKLLKWVGLHDDGHGHFVNSIKLEEMDLTDSYLRPYFFDKPEINKYLHIREANVYWRNAKEELNKEDIEFYQLEIKLIKN